MATTKEYQELAKKAWEDLPWSLKGADTGGLFLIGWLQGYKACQDKLTESPESEEPEA
jgi:hypothetical protein